MINSIKAELEKRTGLPAATVDQVLNALGEVVNERYPQYAGLLSGVLGIPTAGAQGTTGAGGQGGTGGIPDLGGLGNLLGGQGGTGGPAGTGGTPS